MNNSATPSTIEPAFPTVRGTYASFPAQQLAIIVATFNERDNAPQLIRHLDAVLDGMHREAIFIDDELSATIRPLPNP